jgi:hypothetical protein
MDSVSNAVLRTLKTRFGTTNISVLRTFFDAVGNGQRFKLDASFAHSIEKCFESYLNLNLFSLSKSSYLRHHNC